MVSKNAQSLVITLLIILATQNFTIATVWPAKTHLITVSDAYNSKTAGWIFFMSSNFTKHDETQPLTKFKRIWCVAFRATLNFQNLDANVEFVMSLSKVEIKNAIFARLLSFSLDYLVTKQPEPFKLRCWEGIQASCMSPLIHSCH